MFKLITFIQDAQFTSQYLFCTRSSFLSIVNMFKDVIFVSFYFITKLIGPLVQRWVLKTEQNDKNLSKMLCSLGYKRKKSSICSVCNVIEFRFDFEKLDMFGF